MGVKNLYKIIKENAPDAIKTVTIDDLKGWKIGIDASIMVYQMCSVGKTNNIVNKKGKYIQHIQGIFYRTLNMILNGIKPAFIFDSAPSEAKSETIAKRKTARESGKSVRVPREVFDEVKQLLTLMGVKIFQAPGEAEAQASFSTTNGYLDAVGTSDMDAIPFGARFMIRGLDTAAKNITVVETAKVLSELKLTRQSFIDLCILLGTDYTGTLPKIGYKRALALVKKHGTVEKIITAEKITPPDNFKFVGARAEFVSPVVSGEKIDPDVKKLTREDIKQLENFLITTHGLEPSRVKKSLDKLAKFHGVNLPM